MTIAEFFTTRQRDGRAIVALGTKQLPLVWIAYFDGQYVVCSREGASARPISGERPIESVPVARSGVRTKS